MTASDMSRRAFVGSAGTTLAAAAVAGASAAQAAPASAAADAAGWDFEADVVVVGSGLGVWGALKAATDGASVILLEKQTWGGSAGVSEGTFWIPTNPLARPEGFEDTPEEALEYMENISEGHDVEVIKSFLDAGPEFVNWSADELGCDWDFDPYHPDCYYDVPGQKLAGRCINLSDEQCGVDGSTFPSRGVQTWAYLQEQCDKLGVQVMMDTRATHLVQDESGRVTGLVAETADGEIRIGATKGVLMACGGFDHNAELRREYFKMPAYNTLLMPGATGDGVYMGREVGAAFENMSHYMTCQFWCPDYDESQKFDPDFAQRPQYNAYTGWQGKPGALLLNKRGQRFCNEAGAYGTFPRVYDRYDTANYENYPDIPSYFICDSKLILTYSGGQAPEFFTQADTLEELLEKMGLPVEDAMASIERFNENASEGADPDFTRGEHACEECWGDFMGLYPKYLNYELPNPNLAPLDVPPFYGCVMVPGTNGCNGGMKINAKAQVIDLEGNVIPGLYAAGTAAAHVGGPSYAAGGVSIASGSVMSYVAAREMLAESK